MDGTRIRLLASMTRGVVWLEGLATRPRGALVLFVLGLAVYAVRALAWPLTAGRDLDEYFYAYVQLFDQDVLLPWSMLFRTPVTPIVAGISLDVLDGALAEPLCAILFALSVVAWSAAARTFGPRVALVTAAALLVYPSYGLMFHELASETTFAAAFALWAWLVARAASRPSVGRFALVGLGIALLALVRPGNAVLLAFVVFPFVIAGTWRDRWRCAGALGLAAVLPLAAWTVHNGLRFDTYALARGGNAIIPFYRAFITDHIVAPENGDASRDLAAAMQRHLLTRDPYRSYDVTLEQLFRDGSFRVHEDLYILSDQVFGWGSDYEVLREAGVEGVRADPGTYATGVLGTVWDQLSKAQFRGGGVAASARPAQPGPAGLPPPTEGEPIPAGQVVWISRPDQSIRQVWTSATDWHFEFENPGQRPRFEEIQRETNALFDALPDRNGKAQLGLRLNQLSRWFPRPWMWIAAGIIGISLRRPRGSATLAALALAGLAVVLLNALGLFADLHFVLPVAPAFVLLGAGGLLGARTGRS
jgi:Dolichyl-phosphate-mannose-protein mannosyltransferase